MNRVTSVCDVRQTWAQVHNVDPRDIQIIIFKYMRRETARIASVYNVNNELMGGKSRYHCLTIKADCIDVN